MQDLDPSQDHLGLAPQQLSSFTSYYSNAPHLKLSRLVMDPEEVRDCMPTSAPAAGTGAAGQAAEGSAQGGLCFRTLLSMSSEVSKSFNYQGAVQCMVSKLFTGLDR